MLAFKSTLWIWLPCTFEPEPANMEQFQAALDLLLRLNQNRIGSSPGNELYNFFSVGMLIMDHIDRSRIPTACWDKVFLNYILFPFLKKSLCEIFKNLKKPPHKTPHFAHLLFKDKG